MNRVTTKLSGGNVQDVKDENGPLIPRTRASAENASTHSRHLKSGLVLNVLQVRFVAMRGIHTNMANANGQAKNIGRRHRAEDEHHANRANPRRTIPLLIYHRMRLMMDPAHLHQEQHLARMMHQRNAPLEAQTKVTAHVEPGRIQAQDLTAQVSGEASTSNSASRTSRMARLPLCNDYYENYTYVGGMPRQRQ